MHIQGNSLIATTLETTMTTIGEMLKRKQNDADERLLHVIKTSDSEVRKLRTLKDIRTRRCKDAERVLLSTAGSIDQVARTYQDLNSRPIAIAAKRYRILNHIDDTYDSILQNDQLVDNATQLMKLLRTDKTKSGNNFRCEIAQ